jgi:uncharacterized membrane protein
VSGRVVVTAISASTGTCFAVLAALSIRAAAFPARRLHIFSVVIAAVAIGFGYLAFRAALAGQTNEETVTTSLRRGMVGAFAGLIVMIVFLLFFGPDTRAFLAHALNKTASSFTDLRLMVAAVLLGFGTGFVMGIPKALAGPGNRA